MKHPDKQTGVDELFIPTISEVYSSPLTLFVKSIHPISDGAEEYINTVARPVHVRKGELVACAGEVCPYLYLVLKGIVRGYVQSDKREITTWITGEGQLVTCILGFDLQEPSHENMQALEDCELVALHHDDLEYMYDHFPEINVIGRKVLQQYYRDAEERAYISRLTEATAKYTHFLYTKSDMAKRVPLKYIASYLGMTMETLSRIRSRLSKRKPK